MLNLWHLVNNTCVYEMNSWYDICYDIYICHAEKLYSHNKNICVCRSVSKQLMKWISAHFLVSTAEFKNFNNVLETKKGIPNCECKHDQQKGYWHCLLIVKITRLNSPTAHELRIFSFRIISTHKFTLISFYIFN